VEPNARELEVRAAAPYLEELGKADDRLDEVPSEMRDEIPSCGWDARRADGMRDARARA